MFSRTIDYVAGCKVIKDSKLVTKVVGRYRVVKAQAGHGFEFLHIIVWK